MLQRLVVFGSFLIASAVGKCYNPSPAFPVPAWTDRTIHELRPVFAGIEEKIEHIINEAKYENVSFSIEVTTSAETIWQRFHTAVRRTPTRPGTDHVDSSSQYRIASISKLFTTLAVLYEHQSGNLALDAPILNYVSELSGPDSGELPWKDITLRSLSSHLSGIPRDSFQCDYINLIDEPWARGLPPVSREGLPACNEYNNYEPCSRSDFLGFMKKLPPVFAPNQLPTYSNNGFVLLGLAIENATGMTYEDYVRENIFEPLNMTSSTTDTPPDTHAVLPADGHSWDVDEAVANPTGGVYSSSADMSKFLRYILTHFNTLATGVNWLKPTTYSSGSMHGFYGLPFEIFRTERVLAPSPPFSGRPVTYSTKSGGLLGYLSHVLVLEEYGLGITILVGSSGTDVFPRLLEAVSVDLVRGAEAAIWRDVADAYAGTYVSEPRNASLRLAASSDKGLVVEAFVSNGTDALPTLALRDTLLGRPDRPPAFRAQIFPTLLFKNESAQRGEIWRAVAVPGAEERRPDRVWDDYCISDIDTMSYAGLPLNEIVFWHEEEMIELTAFRMKLKLEKDDSRFQGLRVQG